VPSFLLLPVLFLWEELFSAALWFGGSSGRVLAIGLAAVFSAEISASDAILFMLTTSLAQDFYKRFINRAASDDRVLALARWAALLSGATGALLAIVLGSVVNALTIFYTLIGVSLFVPIVAGLYSRRTTSAGALATMISGVCAALVVHTSTAGRGASSLPQSPALLRRPSCG